MNNKAASNYFLGIDGGGTKTVFKLVDDNGAVLSKIYKGSGNPNDIGLENVCAMLTDGINEVTKGIPFSKITMFAGLSGGGLSGENAEQLNRFFDKFGFFAFCNGSDIENLISLSEYEKYILVIMGTGFIVYTVNGEEKKRISGWGQFFDDGGSGYTLGRDAVTAVLCETDGSGKKTLLTPLSEERLGESAEAHLAKFYRGGKQYIASFSDLVFKAAELHDTIALEILEKNMKFAGNKINTAVKNMTLISDNEKIPVLFSGGLTAKKDILFPLIEKHIKADCQLIHLESEPVDGAIRRAKKIFEAKIK